MRSPSVARERAQNRLAYGSPWLIFYLNPIQSNPMPDYHLALISRYIRRRVWHII